MVKCVPVKEANKSKVYQMKVRSLSFLQLTIQEETQTESNVEHQWEVVGNLQSESLLHVQRAYRAKDSAESILSNPPETSIHSNWSSVRMGATRGC